MRYWLFQVMHENRTTWKNFVMNQPSLWETMVNEHIAAQNYPIAPHKIFGYNIKYSTTGSERSAKHNIDLLRQLKENDMIVAAFTNLRFAGYGQLTTDFYVDGPPLKIIDREGLIHGFCERFGCNWTIIPFGKNPIDCHDLAAPVPGKKTEKDIWLHRGSCVKEIEKHVFEKLRARLDKAGAKSIPPSMAHG
jgi:hypothetical protein